MLNGDTVLYIVFTANFVGILCARSLHFQFYSWWVRQGMTGRASSAEAWRLRFVHDPLFRHGGWVRG